MLPNRQGSFRLFRLFGIDVYLHWLWFLLAFYSITQRVGHYESPVWGVFEYLGLFLIVMIHEFGHALACRSVGGSADQIILWPLGGVAYVQPPSRPGATLWSIAAGPLVNVVFVPITVGLHAISNASDWGATQPDLAEFITTMMYINGVLLVFNLLPVYPLDGGQILRSLLWYGVGRARSLTIATVIGLLGGGALLAYTLFRMADTGRVEGYIWQLVICFFLLSNCWRSFQYAKNLRKLEKLPRRAGFHCPECHAEPLLGPMWRCARCGQPVDLFATAATCPHCGTVAEKIPCVDCGAANPLQRWDASVHDI